MSVKTATVQHRGCRLTYDVDGSGPPVLFIQGTGVHGDAWRPQIDELRNQFTCLSFDNRGIARSQPRGVFITVPTMADDALTLMDAVGWSKAHVVGHSLGGAVAQELALLARDRVQSLSLLCTFSRGRDAMQLSPSMIWTGLRTRIGTKRQRRNAFLEMVMAPSELLGQNLDKIAADLAPVFGHDLASQPAVAMMQLRALGRFDSSKRLGALKSVPTLVVSAEFDRISPPWVGKAIAAGIPGARYEEIPNAGHGVPLLHAAAVNRLLREHFISSGLTS
ncbi:MAG: alpha/beta fold hydrolase [Gemmatimonas sp.]